MSNLYRILFLTNLSILFFSFTYFGAEHMFTKYDLLIILIIFIVIIFLQSIIIILLKKNLYKTLILCFFCTFNIISLHLVFIETIHFLPFYFEILIFITCFLLILFICIICGENSTVAKFFIISPVFLFTLFFLINSKIISFKKIQNISIIQNESNIIFNNRPNIYFISFESMVPLSIAKKNFKQPYFAYHKVLDDNFYKFKNAFTLAFPSKESLNSLLAFDQKKYLLLKKKERHMDFFTGEIESPLLNIFKNNNYELSTFYDNFWFGRNKGKYIDNYYTNEAGGKFNTCAFDPGYGLHLKVSFLGYCLLNEKIKFKIISFLSGKELSKTTAVEKIIEIMKKNINKSKPQFFMAHNINPGHTAIYKYGNKESFDDFVNTYKNKSMIVKKEIQNILDFIKKNDPNSILFLYADHGPKLTSGMELEENPRYKILDSFAVYAGIYPKRRCDKYANYLYKNRDFASLVDAAKVIINCLAENKNALTFNEEQYFMDGPEIKYFNDDKNIILGYKNEILKLNNYIYE